MQTDVFRTYCEQYEKVMKWFTHHQKFVDHWTPPYETTNCHQVYRGLAERKYHHGKAKVRGRAKKNKRQRHPFNDDKRNSERDVNEAFEMIVTDEMAQFFTISAQHRKEREERKETLRKIWEDSEDADPEDRNEEYTTSVNPLFAKLQKPGERRLKEMQELYGEGATKIFAMETAMQLSFQKFYDQKAPQLWPTLPLNIKFI